VPDQPQLVGYAVEQERVLRIGCQRLGWRVLEGEFSGELVPEPRTPFFVPIAGHQ